MFKTKVSQNLLLLFLSSSSNFDNPEDSIIAPSRDCSKGLLLICLDASLLRYTLQETNEGQEIKLQIIFHSLQDTLIIISCLYSMPLTLPSPPININPNKADDTKWTLNNKWERGRRDGEPLFMCTILYLRLFLTNCVHYNLSRINDKLLLW